MTMIAPTRGRPRGFDRDKALDGAVAVFHALGWRGATYDALEKATGLRRQSLVYAFGDKRALFEAALDRYAEKRVGQVLAALDDAQDPARGIREAFALWLEDATRPIRRGCLIVNAAGEAGAEEEAVASRLAAASKRLVKGFSDAFARAKAMGRLRTDADPTALAQAALALGDGALLHARGAGRMEAAAPAFDAFLASVLKDG